MRRPIQSAQSVKVRADRASEELKRRMFIALCEQRGLPEPQTEYRFASPRQWRFDFAWPRTPLRDAVALEVEGGVWVRGAHGRGKHMLSDMEKYNTAAINGWRLLRCTPSQLCTAEMIDLLRHALHL